SICSFPFQTVTSKLFNCAAICCCVSAQLNPWCCFMKSTIVPLVPQLKQLKTGTSIPNRFTSPHCGHGMSKSLNSASSSCDHWSAEMSLKLTAQLGLGSPFHVPDSLHCAVGLPVLASFTVSTLALYVNRLFRVQYLSPRL